MPYYLLIFLSVIGLAGNFCLTKLYQNNAGTGMHASVVFNIVTGACAALTPAIFMPCSLMTPRHAKALCRSSGTR